MKKNTQQLIALFLVGLLVLSFAACKASTHENSSKNSEDVNNDLWETATYLTDTELGEGFKTFTFEVSVKDKIVTFTIHTDKETVGEALLELNLIAGEEGSYGLYVKKVNGITADYDIDQSYWAFYIDGEYAMSGADTTNIEEGTKYKFEYTK